MSSIGELDLSNSNFNDEQLIPILNILKGDTVVHTLNLSNNNIKVIATIIMQKLTVMFLKQVSKQLYYSYER